ncbi:WD40-repeat-containing domain protein [Fimicolochytrium jonesii]|uniref:WD40-repeat-containing domain protein n=1 Tax=Fimicolochytrium jonesii TaxID=1396493 RepID=UPI0022FEF712|nr:WD40-repeat-containing domain protein [Fimicolochytrium jonesii]KAI8823543.1 WD40-repeat-containing domain protein [Fimicolochytrium jonesii]
MKSFLVWQDKVQDTDGIRQPIYDVAFLNHSNQLVATAGTEILVYDAAEGELLRSLKAHKDTVLCLTGMANGFASGGADKQVVIWNNKLEGILKYSHNDTIQAISESPVGSQVVSCTATDFGIWSADVKSVAKHKVPSRICTVSWTPDGQTFALGLFNGHISIRSRSGEERLRIERGDSPVWSIAWNPSPTREYDLLAVADWNQRLSFFQLSGRQVGKDRPLGYDPCTVSYFGTGEYVALGGSDRKVTLWTTEGARLGQVCELDNWIWSCKVKPRQNYVAVGTHDGIIAIYQVTFNTVHGLYHDRYAYRESMTDVVIQHLSTNQRARIKCRDWVKKIAVHKDRLAVQLPEKIIIYELFHDDASDMHYRIKQKIAKKVDCNLLVVTAQNIIFCMERKLQSYNFQGEAEREWILGSTIRYIKVIGGRPGREGLLVGLKDGQISQIFINNPFPVEVLKMQSAVRCLDLSLQRKTLAVVDEHNICFVYDMKSKQLLYQEPNANSVACNTELEDIICYSGGGLLNIKANNFPPHQQKMQGFVVGFKGSHIFCLHVYSMTTVDVPQSASLERYLDKKDFDAAYKVACLGVTEADWRRLALDALEASRLDVALKAFIRTRDMQFIDLIRGMEKVKSEGKWDPEALLADVYAYTGRFQEAAKLYKKTGNPQKAIDMYTELNMWDQATAFAHDTHTNMESILHRKAQTQHDRNDLLAAAETYAQVGDFMKAIDILGPNGRLDKLMDVARKLDQGDTKGLSRCVYYFRKNNHHAYAAETLVKMGDIAHLLKLHIELQHWDEAFKLAETHPELLDQIYLPYANYLATNGDFLEAQENFRKAGKVEEALKVLGELTENAVVEHRFDDAAYYYWTMSSEQLDIIPRTTPLDELSYTEKSALKAFRKFYASAEVYYAYYYISRYIDEPFTSHLPETLFNMARFILHYLNHNETPKGVSKVYTLYALARLSQALGAFKVARYAFDKLQTMVIPPQWQEIIDVGTLTIRAHPNLDKENLQPICYHCSTLNPLVNPKGNVCTACGEPFVVSFYSFVTLPVVQFAIEQGVGHDEAMRLVLTDPVSFDPKQDTTGSKDDTGKPKGGLVGTHSVRPSSALNSNKDDPFARQLAALTTSGVTALNYTPLLVGRKALIAMDRQAVLVRHWDRACIPTQYYKTMITDVPIVCCTYCKQFFLEDEWAYQVLKGGGCPFCRGKVEL